MAVTSIKKKINWKVRFKNKVWLLSFISLIVGFVFSLLRLFEIELSVTEEIVIDVVSKILTFLGLFGVVIDPTTEGLYDSERALGYEEPWVDETEGESEE